MLKKLNHIGIATSNLDSFLAAYKIFGLKPSRIETLGSPPVVRAAFIKAGDQTIEPLQPLTPEHPIARFIKEKGEGLHHLCFEVDDVDKELDSLASQGVPLLDRKGRIGLTGKIAFIDPKATGGVLIELVQPLSQ